MIIKDSNLRRTLFENRYKILAIIIAIILVLCIVRVLNEMAKQELKASSSSNTNTTKSQSTYKPQETILSGGNVSEKKQEVNTKVIGDFIEYCNEKEIEKAYNLLTEECKQKIFYSDIEKFKTNYVERIFTSKKIYSMQSWISSINDTYKIRILNDILATGKTEDAIEDYYTIVNKNGEYKLNINNYIGTTIINKEKTVDNITITIVSKDTYMDYETYKVKVQNDTENTILLDSKEKKKSVYLTGNNNATYTGYMYELDNVLLTIKPRIYTNINIRFNKIYNPNIQVSSITFSDIINNVDEYNQAQNKQNYTRKNSN